MRKDLTPAGVLLACMLPIIASGQAERVTDLNTTGAGSDPAVFTRLGANTFFIADDGEHGTELWVIPDGAAARLVKDIIPGPLSSSPSRLTAMGTHIFFAAMTEEEGRELWISDGSEGGTLLVADIFPGVRDSGPQFLTVYDGSLFFSADDGVAGRELWTATASGASLVADIEPGAEGSWPSDFLEIPDGTGAGSMLIFIADTAASGIEPWLTKGTAATTEQLEDLNPGPGSSDPADFAILSDQAVFWRADDGGGSELWRYDPAGDTLHEHVVSAPDSGSFPNNMTAFDGDLYFRAYDPSDGAELAILEGTDYSISHFNLMPDTVGGYPDDFLATSGSIFFAAEGDGNGRELWYVSTASFPADTDINPGAGDSAPSGMTANHAGTVFFSADDGTHGAELWKVTPAAPGLPGLVKDIRPGASGALVSLNELSIVADATGMTFRANDGEHGIEPWHSDGTEAGTQMLADINTDTADSAPSWFIDFAGEIYFAATDAEHGRELRAFDGATIRLVKDIYPGPEDGSPIRLTVVGDALFFTADDGVHGAELWKTDGTDTGTVLVKDVNPGPANSSITELFAFGDSLLFQAEDASHGHELWSSDGTEAGTQMVVDLNPGNGSSSPIQFTELGGVVYFRASDGPSGTYGRELWKTDGTAAGTVIAVDLVPGPDDSWPFDITRVVDLLYFSYETTSGDRRLAKSDGTDAGTTTVADLDPSGAEDDIFGLTYLPALDLLVFAGETAATGREPWVSDGTSDGTTLIADIHAGAHWSYPEYWVVYNDTLYFSAVSAGYGAELWGYEPGGTPFRVTDVYAGSGSSHPRGMTVFDGKMYINMSGDDAEFELWSSDGTAAGTVLAQDIDTHASAGSDPWDFFVTEDYLLFSASDGETGRELWKLEKGVDGGDGGDDDPAPPTGGGGGGGGALGWAALCALLGIAIRRRYTPRLRGFTS